MYDKPTLTECEEAVVKAAVRFVDCCGEFEGELKYCSELLDALEAAVVKLEKRRAEIKEFWDGIL